MEARGDRVAVAAAEARGQLDALAGLRAGRATDDFRGIVVRVGGIGVSGSVRASGVQRGVRGVGNAAGVRGDVGDRVRQRVGVGEVSCGIGGHVERAGVGRCGGLATGDGCERETERGQTRAKGGK